jgi:hypothetical protein
MAVSLIAFESRTATDGEPLGDGIDGRASVTARTTRSAAQRHR